MGSFKHLLYSVCRGLADSLSGFYLVFTIHRADTGALCGRARRDFSLAARDNRHSHTHTRSASTLSTKSASGGMAGAQCVGGASLAQRLCQCCLLNGGVLLCSQLMFGYALLPAVRALVRVLWGAQAASSDSASVWSTLSVVLSWTFSTLWLVPVFFISRFINCIWFQDIADAAFRNRQSAAVRRLSISVLVADTMFSVFTQILFLLQATLFSYLVPVYSVSCALYTVHLSLLYSLYSFEYRWYQHGWQLDRRLAFLETHWPYFVGFGLPLALITQSFHSYLLNGCLFSVLFPVFIVSGNEAKPVTDSCDMRLQLFTPVIIASNAILKRSMPSTPPAKLC